MLQCFDPEPPEPSPPVVESRDDVEAETDGSENERGALLVCAACGHPITRAATRTTVDGKHEHTRANPHGYVYRFGCFRRAPGCSSRGVPSKQATWFADHFWHAQACGGCGEHIGWLFFVGNETSFYGLILDQLREIASPAAN